MKRAQYQRWLPGSKQEPVNCIHRKRTCILQQKRSAEEPDGDREAPAPRDLSQGDDRPPENKTEASGGRRWRTHDSILLGCRLCANGSDVQVFGFNFCAAIGGLIVLR